MWDFLTVPALAVPYRSSLFVFPIIYIYIIYSVGHYPNTALFNPPPIFPLLAGELPKLFKENNYEKTRFDG